MTIGARGRLRVLDLFSGIGGFSLGLERVGMQTVAFCEIEPYCRAVLRKHWPGVPIFEDVRALHGTDVAGVDLICGGFPCQDISLAGRGAGLAGARSGLWSEFRRLIEEIRPRFVIIENVAALRSRGLDTVLGELAALGFDAEWHCIPASAVGAPHQRDRVWIIAYAREASESWRGVPVGRRIECPRSTAQTATNNDCLWELQQSGFERDFGRRAVHSAAQYWPMAWTEKLEQLCRMDDGLPGELDETHTLLYGNSVVPQIPEMIGRAIIESMAQ